MKKATSPFYLVLDLETVIDPDFKDQERDKAGKSRFPSPPCHQILCAGYAFLESHRVQDWGVLGEDGDEDEETILKKLTYSIRQTSPTIVGMNSRGFDLPVIASRALRHGIPFPWYYATKNPRYRYAFTDHLDIMDLLCDHGAAPKASLDVWARLVGFPGKQGTDGSDIPLLLASGGVRAVADYCMSDVVQTCALLLRTDLLRGILTLPKYKAAALELLKSSEADIRTAGLVANVDRNRFLLTPRPALNVQDVDREVAELAVGRSQGPASERADRCG